MKWNVTKTKLDLLAWSWLLNLCARASLLLLLLLLSWERERGRECVRERERGRKRHTQTVRDAPAESEAGSLGFSLFSPGLGLTRQTSNKTDSGTNAHRSSLLDTFGRLCVCRRRVLRLTGNYSAIYLFLNLPLESPGFSAPWLVLHVVCLLVSTWTDPGCLAENKK